MNRAEIKAKARKAIGGKVANTFLVFLVASLLLGFVTTITLGLGGILFTGAMMLATAFIFLGVVKKNRTPEFDDIFYGVRGDNFGRGLFGYLRYSIFTFLWSLLFVIPGIVKGFAYSMMFFIMADEPEVSAAEAQRRSIAMTRGYKAELFVLQLSFIPWFLLVGLTFGLAGIYVFPYMQATQALYYEALKKRAA